MENLKNEKSIEKCMEYSENKEALESLLKNIDVEVEYVGLLKPTWGGQKVSTYEVTIKNIKKSKKIDFLFYQSIRFTEMKEKIKKEYSEAWESFLYTVLCDVRVNLESEDNFNDFCCSFGYNPDSIKDHDLYKNVMKHKKLLLKVFDINDVECLPF